MKRRREKEKRRMRKEEERSKEEKERRGRKKDEERVRHFSRESSSLFLTLLEKCVHIHPIPFLAAFASHELHSHSCVEENIMSLFLSDCILST